MLKHTRKATSLLLTLAMLLVSLGAFAVSADDSLTTEEIVQLTPSPNALYSVTGANAPANLCQMLESHCISVTDDTLIEIVPSTSRSSATNMVVTSVNDETINKALLMTVDENGDVVEFPMPVQGDVSVYGSGEHRDDPYDDSLIFCIGITFNSYLPGGADYYYQPISVYFSYSNNDPYTISSGYAKYSCCGYQYTYPGYTLLTTGWQTYTYTITVEADNPVEGRVYYTTEPYSTSKVIKVGPTYNSGNFVDYSFGVYNTQTGKSESISDRWVFSEN